MKLLDRFKIASRLGFGFAVVLVLTAVVGTFAVREPGKVDYNTTDLATNWLDATRELGEYSIEESTVRRAEASYTLADKAGDAVDQLDQVTQQNAALVEESAAAAESLKVQAAHLAQVVATFKLDAMAHS